ncbi:MAG: anthranilate synthase component I family protein [Bacteroidales bacterium]|nr:anthranilate synthase component I family protein [Bacteroidales bacterium]
MRRKLNIKVDNVALYKHQLYQYALNYPHFAILNSHHYPSKFPFIAALGAISILTPQKDFFDSLFYWKKNIHDWVFGHLSYDLKNEIEPLQSNNPDFIHFPLMSFFQPQIIIFINNSHVCYQYPERQTKKEIQKIHSDILSTPVEKIVNIPNFKQRMSREEYFHRFNQIKRHIQLGNIYEINFCQEFYCENFIANPALCFNELAQTTPMPFSAFYRHHHSFLLCASPERYLKKEGLKICSQPIKGTQKRSSANDIQNKHILENNAKEHAENVMIVDLVRNDLSRTANKNSVKVKELCKVYAFPTVFQMISTIESKVSPHIPFTDIIKTTFPMGSMTGAPKIKAMEIIEQYEKTKRGLFSGSVGYITPDNDFDFNVVIRSLQINQANNYANFITGGAITIQSEAENEYSECFVKAQGLLNALKTKIE